MSPMVREMALGLTVVTAAVAGAQVDDRPVKYASFMQNGVVYHTVVADLTNDRVSVETRFAPRLTSVRSLFGQEEPVAALTGTFFAWENQKPVGDVVVEGDVMAKGRRGSVLAVDWFGKVHIFHPAFRQEIDWFPYRFALRGTVRLLENGKVVPDPRSQHFRDKSIWGKAARTAVGVTKSGKIVFCATPQAVTLSQLGWALVGQGVQDAVSLDGGGSTALFYRGQMVVPTGRRLCNMVVLCERSPFDTGYQAHLSRVAKNQTDGVLKAIGRLSKD